MILGAFGCGAFKNPPSVVADAFLQVIKEEDYFREFKNIVFAIKPTGMTCPNMAAFARTMAREHVEAARLETTIKSCVTTNNSDTVALLNLFLILVSQPMYFPVQKDIGDAIIAFTSLEQTGIFDSDTSTSFIKLSPEKYLPDLLNRNIPVIINPYSEHKIELKREMIACLYILVNALL